MKMMSSKTNHKQSEQKTWNNIHSKISSNNKNERRKIKFVKAQNVSFTVDNGEGKGQGQGQKKPKDPNSKTFKSNREADTHDSKKELFPASVVEKYANWTTMKRIGPGMMNHGNTCYMNSVLQCLLYVPSLSQILMKENTLALRGLNEKDGRNNTTITLMYQRLVEQVFTTTGKSISPRAMINSIRRVGKQFRPHRQEDAHEYLRQLLDCMHEETLKACRVKISQGDIAHTTLFSKVFGGYLRNEMKCLKCNNSSKTYNHFQDLSMELTQGVTSVDSAMSTFMKVEKLGKGNEWNCDKCKRKVQATKQLTISTPPAALVLHMKRFSFGGHSDKIKKHIAFPTTLHLPVSEGNSQKVKYDLTGVVVHHGYSTHNGHYIAYVKSASGQWYEMDDDRVSMTNSKTVMKQQAYLLFYSKVLSSKAVSVPIEKVPQPVPEKTGEDLKRKDLGSELDTDMDLGEVLQVKPKKAVLSVREVKSVQEAVSPIESPVKVDNTRIVMESFPIELITRLPARNARGLYFFKGPLGKLRQYRRVRSPHHSKMRGNNDEDADDDLNYEFQNMPESESESDSDSDSDSALVSELQNEEMSIEGSSDDDSSDTESDSESDSVEESKGPVTATRKQLIELSMRGRDIGGEGAWSSADPDDVLVPTKVKDIIEASQKKLRRMEQKEQAKKRQSEWNQMLDSGRQKKVKLGGIDKSNIFDGVNEFQKLQDSVASDDVDGANDGKVDVFMRKMHHEQKNWKSDDNEGQTTKKQTTQSEMDDMVLRWDKTEKEKPDNHVEIERNALLNFTKDDKDGDRRRGDRDGGGGGRGGGGKGFKGGKGGRKGGGGGGRGGGGFKGGKGGKHGGGRGGGKGGGRGRGR